ncbi:hypothetical protein ACWCQ1_40660 [Streptomyces sp. NPDC002144]
MNGPDQRGTEPASSKPTGNAAGVNTADRLDDRFPSGLATAA